MSVSSIMDRTTGKIAPQYLPTETPIAETVQLYTTIGGEQPGAISTGTPNNGIAMTSFTHIYMPNNGYTHIRSVFTFNFDLTVVFTEPEGTPNSLPPDTLTLYGYVNNANAIGAEYIFMNTPSNTYAYTTLKLTNPANFTYQGSLTYTDIMPYSTERLSDQFGAFSFIAPEYKNIIDTVTGVPEQFTASISITQASSYIKYSASWEPCNYTT